MKDLLLVVIAFHVFLFSAQATAENTDRDQTTESPVTPTMLAMFRQAEEAFRQKPKDERRHACGVKLEENERIEQGKYLNLFADIEQRSKIDLITFSEFNASRTFSRSKSIDRYRYGYVYDRNLDGQVDYLMYNIGIGIMAAPEDFAGTAEEYGFDAVNTMTNRFWHVSDENFDGHHDTLLSRLLAEGWYDGWILAQDKDFDGTYESCLWYPRKFGDDPQECVEDEQGYSAPGRRKGFPIFIPVAGHFLDVVINAASRCKLVKKGKADFYSTPERYIGRTIPIVDSISD